MRKKEKNTKIIYVRHGETDFPQDRIYCDEKEDPSLNQEGLAQVKTVAEYFKNKKIDFLYNSPIKRTSMTAYEIVKSTGVPFKKSNALKERHFGLLEGLFFKEIENNFSEEFKCWKENPTAFKPEGGESVYDLQKRVKDQVGSIVSEYVGKTIIIVSHAGPIRIAIADALKMPLELYRQVHLDYASLTRIDYGKSQNNIIYMNRITYQSNTQDKSYI